MPTTTERQLVDELARHTLEQLAPEELLAVRATSNLFFQKPERMFEEHAGGDEMLGMGPADLEPLLAPATYSAWFVIMQCLQFGKDPLLQELESQLQSTAKSWLLPLFKKLHRNQGESPAPALPAQPSQEQLQTVHRVAAAVASGFGLSTTSATLLADSIVARLVLGPQKV